jgi:TonB-dependent SusC/RagA subfamily outer membrane receptor
MRSAVWWNSLRRLAVGLWALALGALAGGGVPAAAQEVVSGTVVDARSQRPLTGAEVVVQGTDLRDVTDNRGQFEIRNVPGGQLVLIVIRIGYRPISLTVAAGATGIRVPLTESVVALDEVVVTGTAGQQVARSIGNSVGTVDVEDLERIAPKENVADLLSGQVAGVRIVDTGGEVGTGGVTRIRGSSSLSISSTPLIYVDGVRVNNADNDAGVAFFSTRGASRLNDFNADEIERIEVIKGPAAATLYGTEASNGVIQIITKKGRQGRPTVNMHVKQGANWLPDPIDLFTNTFYQQGGLFSGGPIVEVDVLAEDKARGMEWFQTGYVQSYGADVSGGSGFVQFFMSADWDRDEGPVPYNWRNKLSGRGNLSYTPADIFQLDFNLGMVRSKTQSSSTQQPLSTAIIWSCPAPGCEPGSGLPSALDGPYRGYIAYLPEAYEDEIEGFEDVDRTTLSVSARHDPFSWLTHRLTVGGDFATNRTSALFRATGNLGNFFNNGLKQVQSERSAYLTLDYSATATVNATPHLRFATSGGVQFYRRQQETARASDSRSLRSRRSAPAPRPLPRRTFSRTVPWACSRRSRSRGKTGSS